MCVLPRLKAGRHSPAPDAGRRAWCAVGEGDRAVTMSRNLFILTETERMGRAQTEERPGQAEEDRRAVTRHWAVGDVERETGELAQQHLLRAALRSCKRALHPSPSRIFNCKIFHQPVTCRACHGDPGGCCCLAAVPHANCGLRRVLLRGRASAATLSPVLRSPNRPRVALGQISKERLYEILIKYPIILTTPHALYPAHNPSCTCCTVVKPQIYVFNIQLGA